MTERWHLNGFNMSEVIIIRDGPDARGRHYVDGRHQISIAKFGTIEQAREFCNQHNSKLEGHPPMTDMPPCERPVEPGQNHPRFPSGWCVSCGAAPEEGCIRGGPTAMYPDRPYCKDDQSCCDFACGN